VAEITLTNIVTAAGGGVVVPFINKVLGPVADEIGLILGERVRMFRLQNQIRLFGEAQKMLADAGVEAKQVNLKTLLPLMEGASIEDDPALSVKWAALLANAANPDAKFDILPAFADILRQLTTEEAQILDSIFNTLTFPEIWDNEPDREYFIKKNALQVMIEMSRIRHKIGYGQDSSHKFHSFQDNLLRHRLILPAKEMSMKTESGFSSDFRPEIKRVFLSSLGFDFMMACTAPNSKKEKA
jgi:hypothetical protein